MTVLRTHRKICLFFPLFCSFGIVSLYWLLIITTNLLVQHSNHTFTPKDKEQWLFWDLHMGFPSLVVPKNERTQILLCKWYHAAVTHWYLPQHHHINLHLRTVLYLAHNPGLSVLGGKMSDSLGVDRRKLLTSCTHKKKKTLSGLSVERPRWYMTSEHEHLTSALQRLNWLQDRAIVSHSDHIWLTDLG